MSYEAVMASGAREYASALALLAANGFPARFTQTGGMCAAIEVELERGHLLVTDPSEELPWERHEQRGWGVGFYKNSDVSDGPLTYVEDDSECSDSRLVELVRECLGMVATETKTQGGA